MQYLLNQLISGGGSFSRFENTSAASIDAPATMIPAQASTLEGVTPSPVSSPATDDASTTTVTSSDTTDASNPPIVRNDAARVLSVADTSDKASSEKHSSSLAAPSGATTPGHAWLASVDRYYDRLDHSTLLHSRWQHLPSGHHRSSDDWLADSWIEPLIDFT